MFSPASGFLCSFLGSRQEDCNASKFSNVSSRSGLGECGFEGYDWERILTRALTTCSSMAEESGGRSRQAVHETSSACRVLLHSLCCSTCLNFTPLLYGRGTGVPSGDTSFKIHVSSQVTAAYSSLSAACSIPFQIRPVRYWCTCVVYYSRSTPIAPKHKQ